LQSVLDECSSPAWTRTQLLLQRCFCYTTSGNSLGKFLTWYSQWYLPIFCPTHFKRRRARAAPASIPTLFEAFPTPGPLPTNGFKAILRQVDRTASSIA
jgi:hypothetical protein